MLRITVGQTELWDQEKEEFSYTDGFVLEFEHSLLSVSKWESKHQVPFLAATEKTEAQMVDYVECMLLTENPEEDWYKKLTQADVDKIDAYVNSTESATTFYEVKEPKGRGRAEIITAELVYYWMVSFQIPFECETWHLNRLFSLLRICTIKNAPDKKMAKGDIAARNRALNEQRKKQLGTSG